MCRYAGKDGECYPKQKTLAEELGVSDPRQIRRYIKELKDFGLIVAVREGRRNNVYKFLWHPVMDDALEKPVKEETVTSVTKPKEKTPSCFQALVKWFIGYTRQHVNDNYIFTPSEAKALKLILNKITQIVKKRFNGDFNEELIISSFKYIVSKAKENKFIFEHFELKMINNQFNYLTQNQNALYNQQLHELFK